MAILSLSQEGGHLAQRLARTLPGVTVYLHAGVNGFPGATRFDRITDLTRDLFDQVAGLIFVTPCGVAVRALAPLLRDKHTDPAVVVVDVGGRYAVSLLSGHEGGANELALTVGNVLGAEPVISTTTEAVKSLIVGIGCRRGVEASAIVQAVQRAVSLVGAAPNDVRWLASADVKADEEGLRLAARELGLPLRFLPSEEIRASTRAFAHSEFVQRAVNLPAVAEPAALLAGRRTTLLLPKTVFDGITVAIAREDLPWSASAREDD